MTIRKIRPAVIRGVTHVHLVRVHGEVVDVVEKAGKAQLVRWQHMAGNEKLGMEDVQIEKWEVK